MTVLVGVRCSNGIVIGADSAATSAAGNMHLLRLPADKIFIVQDSVIVAGTGSVGLGQRFLDVVEANWNATSFVNSPMGWAKQICCLSRNDFASTGSPIGFGAMIAAPCGPDVDLIEFETGNMQPERKLGKMNFVTMGSGQTLAEPFLAFISRVLWKNQIPTVQSASFGVYWALAHTIKIAPSGVGEPIVIATMTQTNGVWSAKIMSNDETQEQQLHIDSIEKKLGEYPWPLFNESTDIPPPLPTDVPSAAGGSEETLNGASPHSTTDA